MPLVLFLVAGFVLHANAGWFHGAYTVGTVCLVLGFIGVAFIVVALLAMLGIGLAGFRR